MRKFLWGTAIAIVVLAIAAAWVWHWMTGPMYRPGDVRAGKDVIEPLTPPASTGERWQVAPGIELYHFEEGSGTPVLIVHGGPGFPPSRPWKAGTLLGANSRLVYYHQRGCGKSSRPIQAFSGNMYNDLRQAHQTLGLPAQISDIERIRRILGVERLTVIGHSFGAELAALWAAEFPERVQALVFVAPADLSVLPIKSGGNLFELIGQRVPAALKPEYERYLAEYFDFRRAFARTEAQSSEFYGRIGKYMAAAYGPASSEPAESGYQPLAIYCSMGAHHDYRGAFGRVRAPVLVVHGASDMQPESVSRGFAARFAGSRFVSIEGAGHFVFDEQPERFAAVVAPFLNDSRGTARQP